MNPNIINEACALLLSEQDYLTNSTADLDSMMNIFQTCHERLVSKKKLKTAPALPPQLPFVTTTKRKVESVAAPVVESNSKTRAPPPSALSFLAAL